MIHRVVFAERATRDIVDIHDTLLERFGRRAADTSIRELYSHCLGFDLFPRRGQDRHDLEPGLRTVGYRRMATIAFLVEADQVTILRVFAAGREVRFGRT